MVRNEEMGVVELSVGVARSEGGVTRQFNDYTSSNERIELSCSKTEMPPRCYLGAKISDSPILFAASFCCFPISPLARNGFNSADHHKSTNEKIPHIGVRYGETSANSNSR